MPETRANGECISIDRYPIAQEHGLSRHPIAGREEISLKKSFELKYVREDKGL